jgi:CheY-like chemotaxis protein
MKPTVPRVLVIDPDRETLAALQRALGEVGLTDITAVPNASFALTMLERDRPDLIVSRANMPDIDGWELCSIVRSDSSMAGVLFLLLVGADDQVPERPMDNGPDRILVGDFTPGTIVKEVVSLVGTPISQTRTSAKTPPQAWGLRGALDVMDLPNLAQAIALGNKTGCLALALPSGEGFVVFDRGRAVHAEFGRATGEPAFAALMAAAQREAQGSFAFSPWERLGADQPRTIGRSLEQLLLAAAAEMDEDGRAPLSSLVPRRKADA